MQKCTDHEQVVEEKHFTLVLSGFVFAADVGDFIESTVADEASMQQRQRLTSHTHHVANSQ